MPASSLRRLGSRAADAVDLAYRTAIADVDAQEVGKAVAGQQKAGVPDEEIVEAMGRARRTRAAPVRGTDERAAEGRAEGQGLATSGNHDELVERLRG